ncbi:MAG TPA: hypothetical protein VMJ10_03330 [Kofleriaceae bacterium]|nr:hypothetical protein [Kofleriaceae bacterium]
MSSRLGLVVVCVALPALALAKPKVAIEALDGDNDGAITAVVVEQAEHHAKVTGPKVVAKKADELNISDAETPKALKKLRIKLGVDMIIHGKVDRTGGKKVLVITVSGRGKSSTFEVPYKLATAKKFHKELDEELEKRIDPDAEKEAQEEDEDEAAAREKERADKERADKERADRDKERADKERADRDRERADKDRTDKEREHKSHSSHTRTASKDEPDEEVTEESDHPKKKHHHHLEERDLVTQGAVWLDGGGAGLHRTLQYKVQTAGAAPPPVGTGSVSGVLEGEIYPWSFDHLRGGFLNSVGFFGSAQRTVGLSINVPGTSDSAPINEGAYQLGIRYRFTFGRSSLAIGASYWERHFIANRGSLPAGTTLDMPDVAYSAVAPGAIVKIAAAPKVGVMLAADVPLVLSAGEITSTMELQQAKVIAFAIEGGVDIAFAQNYGLRLAALFDQEMLSFDAPQRSVTAATDRTMGVIASFALIY